MAIHPNHPGLSAEVVVDREPLKEYDDDSGGGGNSKVVKKYVQVDHDAQFGICYTIPKGLTGAAGVRSALKIDGKTVVKQTTSNEQLDKVNATRRAHQTCGTTNGRNYTQKFRFAQLNIDEEEADIDETTSKRLKHIGTITLRLSFINSITTRNVVTKQPSKTAVAEPKERLPLLGVVAEKSLKGDARSHQASLDAPELDDRHFPPPSETSRAFDTSKPFAIFHFKYRSLSALKALQVIPRTPSPPPRSGNLLRENETSRFQEVKHESGIKRASTNEEVHEVEFVSNKRLRWLPTSKDEVIVLD